MVAPFMETMALRGKPRQIRPISQSLASLFPPILSPDIVRLPLAQMRKFLGVLCYLAIFIM